MHYKQIAEEPTRQMWSFLVKQGAIQDPQSFIHSVPHCSLVWGKENVAFLKKRHQALSSHHTYHGMEYTEDHDEMAEWFPLFMKGRDADHELAATRMITGTDCNYGALTTDLLSWLGTKEVATLPAEGHVRTYISSRRGRGNVGIPKAFPKSVGRMESRLHGLHAFHTLSFPWPVLPGDLDSSATRPGLINGTYHDCFS
jgi:Malate:quinone oxidoreductase (Mqo)